jgi:bacteriorhodopsin
MVCLAMDLSNNAFPTYMQVLLVTFDNILAFLSYTVQYFRAVPVLLDYFGRPAYPIRYIMWAHTVPTMIYLVGLISNYSHKRVSRSLQHEHVRT